MALLPPRTSSALHAVLFTGLLTPALAADVPTGPAILKNLREFREMGRVLHVAAHPDDEFTQQITYLSRGRHYQAAYLSVTRGDGGQNEIGREFDAELGLARTQELLEARKIDGGRQYFTRALDFGFSKSYLETLEMWNKHEILGDVVRVIRMFRPDVITTAFSPVPGTTHGHHTASAVLALEAFKLAGNPQAYPEHFADGLTPWQPTRIFTGAGRGGGTPDPARGLLRLDLDGTDEVTGESFSSIATRSRQRHITQFGFPRGVGGGRGSGAAAMLQFADGKPAASDIMDGVDTTWARVPGGNEIGKAADAVIAAFNPDDPAASLPALLDLRTRLANLPADLVLDEKRALLDRIVQACLGLAIEARVAQAEAVPGEPFRIELSATARAGTPVRWEAVRYPTASRETPVGAALAPGAGIRRADTIAVPPGTPVSQPYWLRDTPDAGKFTVADSKLIGLPENPPAFPVEFVFSVSGQTLVVATEPGQLIQRPDKPDKVRRLDVVAPVTIHFPSLVRVFSPGATREVAVDVEANRSGSAGTLVLDAPAGWNVSPTSQAFRLGEVGVRQTFRFQVTPPASPGSTEMRAHVEIDGQRYHTTRAAIDYDHLPYQILQPPAQIRAVNVALATRGHRIGYLPGAGDDVAGCLEQMGYAVTTLGDADLTPEKLKDLDAVVIGVRAFNERRDLAANLPGLFAWVESGGTVVAQYNRPNGLAASQLGPYTLSIAGPAPAFRVTDETAPVTFLHPDHAVLTTPNRLGPADWQNWVQERGAYFASSWDEARYVTPLAMNDPGENPLAGSLLVARHGRGHYVYTSLAFFRQLPKGVPGAYRLFANLVSLGQP
jgi:LmbE family N-acetylglucosaminyl deacetylase